MSNEICPEYIKQLTIEDLDRFPKLAEFLHHVKHHPSYLKVGSNKWKLVIALIDAHTRLQSTVQSRFCNN